MPFFRPGKVAAILCAVTLGQCDIALAQTIALPEPPDAAGNRPQPGYDPLGVRVGAFVLYPSLSAAVAYDSNVFARQSNVEDDLSLTLRPAIRLSLDHPTRTISLSADSEIRRYAQLTRQNDEQYRADAQADFNLGAQSGIAARIGFARRTAERGTFENGVQVGSPLFRTEITGSATARHRFNRFALTARVSGERFRYTDILLDDGTVIDQGFRDGRRLGALALASYELSPRTALEFQGRVEDFAYSDTQPADNRDALGFAVLAGARYEVSRLLIARLGIGLRRHGFENPALNDISGIALDGSLRWYPTPLLSLRFDLAQMTSTSSFDLVSAVTVTSGRLNADYEFRRNLIFSATANLSHEDYGDGDDISNLLTLSGQATWKANRWLQMIGRASYETRSSPPSGLIAGFDAVRFSLTARVAR